MQVVRLGMWGGTTRTVKARKQNQHSLIPMVISEFLNTCTFAQKMLIKEPKEVGKAPAMIVFCAFEQMQQIIEYGKKYGFMKSYPLVFVKNYSGQVLKANMKIVGATEYAVVLYRDKLPKFNNNNRMIFNWFKWERDTQTPKIHPTQKPVQLLKQLIEIFTDEGDVVIDPCAGSGSTLRACAEINRSCYGFEIKKDYYKQAKQKILKDVQQSLIL